MNKRKISWIVVVLLLVAAVSASGQSKKDAENALRQGNVYLKQGDFDKAIEQFDLAVNLYPVKDRNFQKFSVEVGKVRQQAEDGKREQIQTAQAEHLAKEKQEQERLEQAFVSIPVTPESSFKFDLKKEGLVITGYTGTAKEVRIPTSIQGVPVWGIEVFLKTPISPELLFQRA